MFETTEKLVESSRKFKRAFAVKQKEVVIQEAAAIGRNHPR